MEEICAEIDSLCPPGTVAAPGGASGAMALAHFTASFGYTEAHAQALTCLGHRRRQQEEERRRQEEERRQTQGRRERRNLPERRQRRTQPLEQTPHQTRPQLVHQRGRPRGFPCPTRAGPQGQAVETTGHP